MAPSPPQPLDVVVVGAGPAGVVAALRAARLGAKTALITRDQFGGMAANDGPVPVRTLAQAARLIREARQLPLYGIAGGEPSLDYPRLLARVREVTADARRHTLLRDDLERAGVGIHEQAGTARFVDAHTVESDNAPRLRAGKIIICTGGTSRPLAVPGFDLTATHSDAWDLSSVPPSLLVIGGGATGVQVASIFNAFGSRVHLIEIAARILMSEDHEVSETVRAALADSGVRVTEDAGTIDRFERCAAGVRLIHSASDGHRSVDATLAVVAAGWVAATAGLDLSQAGVQTDRRGFVEVDRYLRTTTPHVFAAGDVTGRAMVVHEAIREGIVAATNAVLGPSTVLSHQVSPMGSFTDPEYASVGLTEATARETQDVAVATVRFDSLPRPIIDGRPAGFCKLIVDASSTRSWGAMWWENARSSSPSWRRRPWPPRCPSSNSRWFRSRFPRMRTPWAGRRLPPQSNSITPECGRSSTLSHQRRSAWPELARDTLTEKEKDLDNPFGTAPTGRPRWLHERVQLVLPGQAGPRERPARSGAGAAEKRRLPARGLRPADRGHSRSQVRAVRRGHAVALRHEL
jgi:pyruvate/2-oxoglutarate dehydrogenase complex dihydrolipoamide dehydrogenase (E3) component